jgi:hypothetical protein
MRDLLVLGLLTASTHWLVARSEIARPLWSRARGWLAKLLACAGCSGWWLGLGYGALGLRPVSHGWRGILVAGILGTILTPIFEALLIWGLDETAISVDGTVPEPSPETSSTEEQITPLDRPQR